MSLPREKLYHISEEANITVFNPRPSPSYFKNITDDVVFAISGKLLHNYLFPRYCPRVTFYAGENISEADKEKFLAQTSASFVIAIEAKWLQRLQQTKLYCYEFSTESFLLLDEGAGYYISHQKIKPISVQAIDNSLEELFKRNIELRILPNLWKLADAVTASTLSFSLIRMRNAEERSGANVNKTLRNY